MSEKQEHTALPWVVGDADDFGDYTIQSLDGVKTGTCLLAIAAVISNMRPSGEVKANAALIVRAVNAHHAMLEALELAVSYGWEHESALDAIQLGRG